MSLIDQAATFRGRITDHGVSLTKNEYPQLVLQLQADEIYDDENKVWVDWVGYDEREITAYLVLFGGNKKETLNAQQVKKVTNWDGNSFQALNDMDLSEVGVQFRVEERTYDNKTSFQVNWVDEYDAEPGRTVRKLDPEELKKLDAQYAQLLKQSGKRAAPAKAPANQPPSGVAMQTATQAQTAAKKAAKPKTPGVITKKSKKKAAVVDPLGPPETELQTASEATKITSSKRSTPPVVCDPNLPVGHCTKDEAWDAALGLKAKDVDDETISKVWTEAVLNVAPAGQDAGITNEQWYEIREIVLEKTAMF